MLGSPYCCRDVFRLLLQYGASIESKDKFGETPLTFAIKYARNEAVIIELIEKGANVNVQNEDGISLLCLVFRRRHSGELVKSLLKASSSNQACMEHENVWHCFFECVGYGWKSVFSEFMKLLIEAGVDVTKVDTNGQSPLCLALVNGAGVDDINLLLSTGASYEDCEKHNSSLFCVSNGFTGGLLKADVLKLLLTNGGASVKEVYDIGCTTPLRLALLCCRYETNAIRVMIDSAGMNKNVVNVKHGIFRNLLHFAVVNRFCRPNTVKLLLHNGVRADEKSAHGRTPLHEAMTRGSQDLRIIAILIRHGSPVNLKCKKGYTPLSYAVENRMPGNVFLALLCAGAFIDGLTNIHDIPLINLVLNQHRSLDIVKIMLKWLLIENPNFNVESYPDNVELTNFAQECVLSLQGMDYVNVGHDLALREFIKCPQNARGDSELNFDLNELLQAISNNQFSNFYDCISSEISESLLMAKFQQLTVYSVKHCFDYPSVELKTVVDYDSLCKIVKYLTKTDLLCFILAFYFTSD